MPVMRNAGGYVRVFRSMLDWEWYDDTACVRLMLHLLLSVNWEAKQWHGQTIHPGQLVTSMDKLAESLGTTRSAIRRTIDKLKLSGELTIQTNNHWTTVTLGNWAEYQESQPTNGRPKSQPATDKRPTTDRPPATTEEEKKEKKGSIEEGKSPEGDAADRRDPSVQQVVEFFEEQLGGKLDGPQKQNRWHAASLLKRMASEHPGFDPVVSVKALIQAAREDPFHVRNATSFTYLLKHSKAIIEARKARANNPRTQSDADRKQQLADSLAKSFAQRRAEAAGTGGGTQ